LVPEGGKGGGTIPHREDNAVTGLQESKQGDSESDSGGHRETPASGWKRDVAARRKKRTVEKRAMEGSLGTAFVKKRGESLTGAPLTQTNKGSVGGLGGSRRRGTRREGSS